MDLITYILALQTLMLTCQVSGSSTDLNRKLQIRCQKKMAKCLKDSKKDINEAAHACIMSRK